MCSKTVIMSIRVQTLKNVGAICKNMRPCVEARASGWVGGIVSKMGRRIFWAKRVVCAGYPCIEHCEILVFG